MSCISATSDTVLCLSSQTRARYGVECPTSTGVPIEIRHARARAHTRTHTHARIRAHICTHAHTHTHTHTHTLVLPDLNVATHSQLFLIQAVNTALECQYSSVNLTAFDPFCPKKSYHRCSRMVQSGSSPGVLGVRRAPYVYSPQYVFINT